MTENIPAISHQHGFKHKHSTHTTLDNICHQITKCFNNPRPSQRTVAVAFNMSKTFDTVNIHQLIHKLTLTNIPNNIIKFIANYRVIHRSVDKLKLNYPTYYKGKRNKFLIDRMEI